MPEKNKEQILLITNNYGYSGVTTVHYRLAAAFLDMGYEPILVADNFEHSVTPPKGVACISLENKKWEWRLIFPYIFRLVCLFRRYRKATLIITAKERINFAAILAKRIAFIKVPLICNSHSTISNVIKESRWKNSPIVLFICRQIYLLADFVANVSKAAARDSEKTYHLKKVYYLPNPVVDKNVPFVIKPNPFENPEAINILAAGRLTKVKNYPLMLKAFALALPKNKHLHLTILGDGEDKKTLETLAKTLNISSAVTFLGFVDNAAQYMQHAACLWLTSLYEGFGIVLVEALEQGCPLLSVDCLAGPAEIIGDNEYGILVKSYEPKAHADALLALILQPKKAVEFYRKRTLEFDYHECAKNYLRLIK